jgi:HdeA/HdeB family protein
MLWRRIILGALASPLMTVGSAFAQIVDMRTVTCNDFIGFKRESTFAIVIWLDAYYQDEDDPPIIDFEDQEEGREADRLLQPEPHTFADHRGGADHGGQMTRTRLLTNFSAIRVC